MKTSAGKRLLALVLTLAFCLSLLPATALAGASEPMSLYYDGNRVTSSSEWDFGSTDGYLEQDLQGQVRFSLSGGIPEGGSITAVYLVTADADHVRKGAIYENGGVPSGASGGLEGSNGVWVQNVTLSLETGFYLTEYVTDRGSLYSVDFTDGDFFTPGTVQVVAHGETPDSPETPAAQKPGLTAAVTAFDAATAELACDQSLPLTAEPRYGGTLSWTVNTVVAVSGLTAALTGGEGDAVRSLRISGTPETGGTVSVSVSVTETSGEHGAVTSEPVTFSLSVSIPQKYQVSFFLGDGFGAPGASYEDRQIISGQTVTLPADPIRPGYRFLGWYSPADARTYRAGEQAVVRGKTRFTAQWEAKGGVTVSLENLTSPVAGYVYLVAISEANPWGTSVWSGYYTTAAADLAGEVRTVTIPFWDIVYGRFTALELRALVDGEYLPIARYTGEVGAEQAGETVVLTTEGCSPCSLLSGLTVKTAEGAVLTPGKDYRTDWFGVREAGTDHSVSFPSLTAGGKAWEVRLVGRSGSAFYATQDWTKTYAAALEGDRLTVTLDALAPSVTVSGRVTNGDGPVSGAVVRASQHYRGQERTAESVTDGEGRYSLLLFPSERHDWDEGWYETSFSVLQEGKALRIRAGDRLKVLEDAVHDVALGEAKAAVSLEIRTLEGQEDLAGRYLAARLGRTTLQLRNGEEAASDERAVPRSASLTLQEFLTPYSRVPANGALTAVLDDPQGYFSGELGADLVLEAGLGSASLATDLNPGVLLSLSSQTRADVFLAWYRDDAYAGRTENFSLRPQPQDVSAPAPRGAGTYTLVLFPASYSSLLHAGESFDFVRCSALPEGAALKRWTVTLAEGEIGEPESFRIDQTFGEAIRYVTKPASTIAPGAGSFSSTDDLITFTGTIGLDPGLKDGRLETLIIDPTSFSGQNGNDNMTLSVESVAIGGRVYAPGKPVDHDDQYYVTIPGGAELPCQYAIYAHPQTYRLNMELEVNAHVSHDGQTDTWQRIGQASVARPGSQIATPSAFVCLDTIPVSGMAGRYETVTVYDNGAEIGKASAGYDGRWSAQVTLAGTDGALTTLHSLTAVTSGGTESLPLAVFHRADMPQLTSLTLNWGREGDWRYSVSVPGDFYNFTGSMPNVSLRAAFLNPDRLWQIDPVEGSSATAEAGLPPFKVLFRVTTSDGIVRLLTSDAPDGDGVFEVKLDGTLYSSVVAVDCEFYPLPELMDNYDESAAAAQATDADRQLLDGSIAALTDALPDLGGLLQAVRDELEAMPAGSVSVPFDEDGRPVFPEGLSDRDRNTVELIRAWYQIGGLQLDSCTHEAKGSTTLSDWLGQIAGEDAAMPPSAAARFYSGKRIYADEASFQAEKAWVSSVAGEGHGLRLSDRSDPAGFTYDNYSIDDFVYADGRPVSGTYRITVDFTSLDGLCFSTVNAVLYQGFAGYQTGRDTLMDDAAPNAGGYYYNGNYDCGTSLWDVISGTNYLAAGEQATEALLYGTDGLSSFMRSMAEKCSSWADALGGFGALLDAITACLDFERDYKMQSDLIQLMSTPCYMKLDGAQKARCEAMYQDFLNVMQQRQELDVMSKIGNFLIYIFSSGFFGSAANAAYNAWLAGSASSAAQAELFEIAAGETAAVGTTPFFGLCTAVGAIVSGALAIGTASELHAAIANAYNSTFKYISFLCSQKAAEMEDPNCKKKKEKEKEDEVKPVPDKPVPDRPRAGYIAAVAGGRLGVQNDPSGVVYEAVIQNPVEGAVVTLRCGADGSGQMSSRTGDGVVQLLPAADAAPVTPAASTQITGADGRFQWFVPEGAWFVAAERAGYQDGNSNGDAAASIVLPAGIPAGDQTATRLLPVLPVQLDVNIPLVDAAAPCVSDVRFVAGEGVYVTFSKYMDEESVTSPDNYRIDGEAFTGGVRVVEALRGNTPENRGTPVTYYTRGVLLALDAAAGTAVTLTVKGGAGAVRSYAGTPMSADFTLTGEMAAAGQLACRPRFTDYPADGTGVAARVDAGTRVALSLPADAPEGARIYYTTDGTMPDGGSRLYTGPIPITEDTTVRAVAVLAGWSDSEAAVGSFTVSVAPTLLYAVRGEVTLSDGASPDGLTLTLTGGGIARTAVVSGGGYCFPELPRDAAYRISFAGNDAYQPFSVTVTVADGDVSEAVRLTSREPLPEPAPEDPGAGEGFEEAAAPAAPQAPDKTEAPARPFTDVAETSWFYDAVYYCFDRGYFRGTSEEEFTPGGLMTRAMFAAVLYRMAGEPSAAGKENPFSDVAEGKYYTDAVLWACGEGIILGYGDGRFGVEDPVTREQMAVLLWRLGGKPAAEEAGLSAFADAGEIHAWARDALAWAVGAGLVRGKGNGVLDPRGDAARAEVAQILMNWDAWKGTD